MDSSGIVRLAARLALVRRQGLHLVSVMVCLNILTPPSYKTVTRDRNLAAMDGSPMFL